MLSLLVISAVDGPSEEVLDETGDSELGCGANDRDVVVGSEMEEKGSENLIEKERSVLMTDIHKVSKGEES